MEDIFASEVIKMEKIIDIKSRLYDYSVEFVEDFESTLEAYKDKSLFVIDKNVYELYKQKFSSIPKEKIYFMNPVEGEKNMDTVMDIITFFKKSGMKKNWKAVCFGGGITQDVTTIASNLYLRNVEWVLFPTTLLSMCDSCIGGKCGINLGEFKNQIGVFYPPKKIYIDVNFINTLTNDDYLNGWGEILKFSLTRYSDFYDELKAESQYIPCDNIERYVYKGLMMKKEVIEEDEFESDLRRILNYGHTFGHALEAFTYNEIPHGKGVIWGIDVVNYIAYKEGLITEDYYLDIKRVIKEHFLTKEIVVSDPLSLFAIIKTDKKVKDNTLNFAMLNGESNLIVYPLQIDEKLQNYFINYLKETHEYYSN